MNVAPDTYTIQITMDGFKTLKRSGVPVSAGDRYADWHRWRSKSAASTDTVR